MKIRNQRPPKAASGEEDQVDRPEEKAPLAKPRSRGFLAPSE
jgi:hypothetical protein